MEDLDKKAYDEMPSFPVLDTNPNRWKSEDFNLPGKNCIGCLCFMWSNIRTGKPGCAKMAVCERIKQSAGK